MDGSNFINRWSAKLHLVKAFYSGYKIFLFDNTTSHSFYAITHFVQEEETKFWKESKHCGAMVGIKQSMLYQNIENQWIPKDTQCVLGERNLWLQLGQNLIFFKPKYF